MVFSCLCSCHSSKKSLFHLYQQNKPSQSKLKFRQAINHCKRVLEAAKLGYGNKTKEYITFQKLRSWDFWQISNNVLCKRKSAIPSLFNGPEVLSSAYLIKQNCLLKTFLRTLILMAQVSLYVFPSRTTLKLHISLTPKIVKKVITNLDFSNQGIWS